jgi:hypothetical protein
MAIEAVGMGTWDELSDAERRELIDGEVWKPEKRQTLLAEKDNRDSDDEDGSLKPAFTKSSRKLNKKKKNE